MTVSIEVTPETNNIALQSYQIVLSELMASGDQIRHYLKIATERADDSEIAALSLLALQCAFGMRLLCLRAACYTRNIEDPAFSKRFWLEVTFN